MGWLGKEPTVGATSACCMTGLEPGSLHPDRYLARCLLFGTLEGAVSIGLSGTTSGWGWGSLLGSKVQVAGGDDEVNMLARVSDTDSTVVSISV